MATHNNHSSNYGYINKSLKECEHNLGILNARAKATADNINLSSTFVLMIRNLQANREILQQAMARYRGDGNGRHQP